MRSTARIWLSKATELTARPVFPDSLVYGQPVSRDFTVEIAVTDSGTLKPYPERFSTPVRHVVMHGLVDEPAPLPRFDDSVDGPKSGLWEDNTDAFAQRHRFK